LKALLAIAVPCHVFVAPQMAQSLARMTAEYGPWCRVRFFGNAVSTFGRNELVRWAQSIQASHMLWIDTDSVFPENAATKLVKSGKGFIGANFALKDGSGQSAAWGLDGERLTPKPDGIEEVSTLGFGLTLTTMEVLEAVGAPWFKILDDERGGPADEYRFCQLARAAGFPPHVDHGLSRACRHVGLHPFALPDGGSDGD
jgi:hypothetical protein